MNEQLVVKNFGPIKDATVDFKRVSVFIGPTGGGKSTLAKLAAIFRNGLPDTMDLERRKKFFSDFSIDKFFKDDCSLKWKYNGIEYLVKSDLSISNDSARMADDSTASTVSSVSIQSDENSRIIKFKLSDEVFKRFKEQIDKMHTADIVANPLWFTIDTPVFFSSDRNLVATYFTSNRIFLPAVEYSWAGLLRDDIGLPKDILDFANAFSVSRKEIPELIIPFLNVKYVHQDGQDFIKIPESETLFRLYETASGIQSVTPLLVLLEHLSRNTEQAQSFIIEEPELNLFPTAQFELVKILVEKCARIDGQNDLVLTTHSPYVLTALNLMCYAFRIAQQDEATAKKVAKLIPRHCWIDPEQFAAYYVDRPDTKRKQQVRSIINKKTGLIEENELDTASEELSNIFDKLLDLRQPVKSVARAK